MTDIKYDNPNLNMTLALPISTVMSRDVEHNYEHYYYLRPGDIYVEVGAFLGNYGIIAQRRQCSKIVLIEAHPTNAATIQQVIDKIPLSNAILVNRAIGLEKGKAKFVGWANSASSRLAVHDKDFPEYWTEVDVDSLDNILTDLGIDHVDLLSSDCEGAEMNLVESAQRYLREGRIKNVAIATYHAKDNHRLVSATLEKYGFQNIRNEEGLTYGHIL